MDVDMRASDEDRQQVIAVLQRHTMAGRLTLDEFSDRVGDVYGARTLGDLAAVTRDLPGEPAPARASGGDSVRHLAIAFAVAVGALILLALLMSLR